MILHVEPVTNVQPIAIDGQLPAFEGVENHQRNEFLGELTRAVVVRAIGGDGGEAIGLEIGSNQVVRGCLRSGVRRVGAISARLREMAVWTERAKDLVRRDVQTPKTGRSVRR